MNKSEIKALVDKWHLYRDQKTGQIGARVPNGKRKQFVAEVRPLKPELTAYFDELEAELRSAAEEHERKVNAIPGLRELRAAADDLRSWREEWNASFETGDGGGIGVRPKPVYDIEAMKEKYPAANAYMKAEANYFKTNYVFSAAGKRAMEAIENDPESWETAIEQMERELSDFAKKIMWD